MNPGFWLTHTAGSQLAATYHVSATILLVKWCPICDAELPPPTGKRGRPRIYCSKECRDLAYRGRKSTGTYEARIQRANCRTCGKEFCWSGPGARQFCYDPCRPARRSGGHQGHRYGISAEEYNSLMAGASFCAACGETFPGSQYPDPLAKVLDHCHDTKTIRGVLHNRCNLALGHSHDSPFVLRALADYLDAQA